MKERDTSAAEAPSTAIRQEPVEAPGERPERDRRHARLLDSIGKLDRSVYPAGYLEKLRAEWRD